MIKPGPTVQAYADLINATPEEVMEWINDYINGPRSNWIDAMCKTSIEDTPAAREESIRGYLKREIA